MTIRQHMNRSAVKSVVRSNPTLTVIGAKEKTLFFADANDADAELVEVPVNVDMTSRQLLDCALNYQK